MKPKFYPSDDNPLWNDEVERVLPWMEGKGLDVGAGGRSPLAEMVRVDIDPKNEPDHVAPMEKLPFPDASFDYCYAGHTLEHSKSPTTALKEFVRVVKLGGYILLIVPDREYTATYLTKRQDTGGNPYMTHYFETNLEEFRDFLKDHTNLEYTIIDCGVAGQNWSNYAVLRKQITPSQ